MASSTVPADVVAIAEIMDSRFRGPFGFRFGIDGLLGLIPGLGDFVTNLFSFYIVLRAVSVGAPLSVIVHMFLNITIDNIIDFIPGLGLILDFFWKSNLRNVELLRNFHNSPMSTAKTSNMKVATFFLFAFLLIVGFCILSLYVAYLFFDFAMSL